MIYLETTASPIGANTGSNTGGDGVKMVGKPHWSTPLTFYRLGHNPDDVDFYDDFEFEEIQSERLLSIARRGIARGHKVTLGDSYARGQLLAIRLPAGDEYRHIFVDKTTEANVAEVNFEDYEYLPGYEAIWHKNLDIVEVLVDWHGSGLLRYAAKGTIVAVAAVVTNQTGVELKFGSPSAAGNALLASPRDLPEMSISLIRTGARTASEATAALDKIGASFLFEVSLRDGDLVSMVRAPIEAESPNYRFAPEPSPYRWDIKTAFPDRVIRSEPLKLFYHAGASSDTSPLRKFTAFYHVLEYHFLICSRLQITELLQEAILDESFDPRKWSHIEQLVEKLPIRTNKGFGNERTQLRIAVRQCVKFDRLSHMLTNSFHDGLSLAEHIGEATRITGVPRVLLSSARNDEVKVLASLADRIYELRNKIVHAKQGTEPLLPFSSEAAYLYPDIEVIRFVAASMLLESAIPADRGKRTA